jgi:predicted NAD/FAD-binding protein
LPDGLIEETGMGDEKWNLERVRAELYEARTKVFVIAKVLETGSLSFTGHPEWALVVKPLLKDLKEYVAQIETLMKEEETLKPVD